jgi:hypothetical protein
MASTSSFLFLNVVFESDSPISDDVLASAFHVEKKFIDWLQISVLAEALSTTNDSQVPVPPKRYTCTFYIIIIE